MAIHEFHPEKIETFRFIDFDFDAHSSTASLRYALDDLELVEQFTFVGEVDDTSPRLEAALRLLHLAAGVSYYKAAAPPIAAIDEPITKTELGLVNLLYREGLGEFAYRNGLDGFDGPQFETKLRDAESSAAPKLPRRCAVAVGGGKDSVVSLEALRRAGEPLVVDSVNRHRATEEIAAAANVPLLTVHRRLAPELFELNAAGALNGHVPVTAIVSSALVLGGLLYGYDSVVMSNERSASVGNLYWNGMEVNHQFSKGLTFERAFAEHVRATVHPELDYFSLLRPLSELGIARMFARMPQFHDLFTSCNAAFRIDVSRRTKRWCGNCSKCRFVFLILAPFLSPGRLTEIFGANLLEDESQAVGFDELIGVSGDKPFECVGEIEESVAAFVLVARDPAWQSSALVKRFADLDLPVPPDVAERALRWSDDHEVPPRFLEMLRAVEAS